MSPETSSGLDAELLDDFFAEAEQHLLSIRQSLLVLEASAGKARPDPKILEELFQNVHSFKGISAIAGLGPAETLSHAAEDFLRVLTRGQGCLTVKGLEILMEVAHRLEQMVGAFRLHKPVPGYESLLGELKEQSGQSTANPTDAGEPNLTMETQSVGAGPLLWKCTFVPSRELEAQGVNINTVRKELSRAGQILEANPVVKGDGALSFEFVVSAQEAPADLSAWQAKGICVESVATASEPDGPKEEYTPFLAPSHLVRIDLNRLDELMRITGEMVIHRSQLEAQLARLSRSAGRPDLRGVQEVSGSLGRSLRELREAITRVRLVRMAEVFARMPFVVRDLSRQTRKKVVLKLSGQDTAIDKYLIERLKDPLLHLVRNAFTHGIEPPEERIAASKPEEATIELSASASGDSVVLQVRDDGRGINPRAIIARAKKLGLEVPTVVDNESLLGILCSSGFSTKEDADRTAGRGVGMAVVSSTVRELGGSVGVESQEGLGTTFTLRLPLTLVVAETLVVSAAGQTCAVPQTFVTEILHTSEAEVQKVNGIEVIPYRNGVLPIIRLARLFQLTTTPKPKLCMLVITSERGSVGLLTDEVLGRREVVVRALRDPLIQVRGIAGATELGDGKPVLILDGTALTNGNVRPPTCITQSEGLN